MEQALAALRKASLAFSETSDYRDSVFRSDVGAGEEKLATLQHVNAARKLLFATEDLIRAWDEAQTREIIRAHNAQPLQGACR